MKQNERKLIKFTGETINCNIGAFYLVWKCFSSLIAMLIFQHHKCSIVWFGFSLQSDYIFFDFFLYTQHQYSDAFSYTKSIHPYNQQTPTRNENYHEYCSEHKSHQHCKKHNHILPHLNWFVDLMWLCESTVVGGFSGLSH